MAGHSPSGFSEQNSEFMVPSIMASHPGSEAAKQPQTITLPPPSLTVGKICFYEMLCWFSAR